MLPDGYNQSVHLGGTWIHFRPLVRAQRESLQQLVSGLPEYAARAVTTEVMADQVFLPSRSEFVTYLRQLVDAQFLEVLRPIAGDPAVQASERDNLRQAALLLQFHPHLLRVTCAQCQYWWYNPHDGVLAKRSGEPLVRPAGSVVPCETEIGCPKGTYTRPIEILPKNALAWRHYRLCSSINRWPQDWIVAENAAVIRSALKEAAP